MPGSASPFPPNSTAGNVRYWNFSKLDDGTTVTIEFDVNVSYRDIDCNVANATAYCPDTGETFSREDSACIDSRADLAVKTTWPEHIKLNPACGNLGSDQVIVNESNVIRVWIINSGPSNITAGESFDVCFDLEGVNITCVNVTGP